jgi:hypothetical protein
MSYSSKNFFAAVPDALARGESLQEIVWKLKRGEVPWHSGRPVPEEHIPFMLASVDFKKLYEEIYEEISELSDIITEYRPPICCYRCPIKELAPEWLVEADQCYEELRPGGGEEIGHQYWITDAVMGEDGYFHRVEKYLREPKNIIDGLCAEFDAAADWQDKMGIQLKAIDIIYNHFEKVEEYWSAPRGGMADGTLNQIAVDVMTERVSKRLEEGLGWRDPVERNARFDWRRVAGAGYYEPVERKD